MCYCVEYFFEYCIKSSAARYILHFSHPSSAVFLLCVVDENCLHQLLMYRTEAGENLAKITTLRLLTED